MRHVDRARPQRRGDPEVARGEPRFADADSELEVRLRCLQPHAQHGPGPGRDDGKKELKALSLGARSDQWDLRVVVRVEIVVRRNGRDLEKRSDHGIRRDAREDHGRPVSVHRASVPEHDVEGRVAAAKDVCATDEVGKEIRRTALLDDEAARDGCRLEVRVADDEVPGSRLGAGEVEDGADVAPAGADLQILAGDVGLSRALELHGCRRIDRLTGDDDRHASPVAALGRHDHGERERRRRRRWSGISRDETAERELRGRALVGGPRRHGERGDVGPGRSGHGQIPRKRCGGARRRWNAYRAEILLRLTVARRIAGGIREEVDGEGCRVAGGERARDGCARR